MMSTSISCSHLTKIWKLPWSLLINESCKRARCPKGLAQPRLLRHFPLKSLNSIICVCVSQTQILWFDLRRSDAERVFLAHRDTKKVHLIFGAPVKNTVLAQSSPSFVSPPSNYHHELIVASDGWRSARELPVAHHRPIIILVEASSSSWSSLTTTTLS